MLIALACALAGPVHADEGQPHWLLNVDALGGVNTAPSSVSGDGLFGARAGVEFMLPTELKSQLLGLDLDYNLLAVGKSPNTYDNNDIDLSLHWLPLTLGRCSLSLKAGIGYNASPNDMYGHFLGFIEPGVRVAVMPRLALDASLQVLESTPEKSLVGSIGVAVGVSVPLDGTFAAAEPSPTPMPTPLVTPMPVSTTAQVSGVAKSLSQTAGTHKHTKKKQPLAAAAAVSGTASPSTRTAHP